MQQIFPKTLEFILDQASFASWALGFLAKFFQVKNFALLISADDVLFRQERVVSVLFLIEKGLKLGNKNFYHVVKDQEKLIAANQLNKKQKVALHAVIKNCIEVIQENDYKTSNFANKHNVS